MWFSPQFIHLDIQYWEFSVVPCIIFPRLLFIFFPFCCQFHYSLPFLMSTPCQLILTHSTIRVVQLLLSNMYCPSHEFWWVPCYFCFCYCGVCYLRVVLSSVNPLINSFSLFLSTFVVSSLEGVSLWCNYLSSTVVFSSSAEVVSEFLLLIIKLS